MTQDMTNEHTTSYDDFKTVSKFKIRWMQGRVILIIISLFLNIFSLWQIFGHGLNFGIDFKGGILFEVSFKELPQIKDVRKFLIKSDVDGVQVQAFGKDDILINIAGSAENPTEKRVKEIRSLLENEYKDNISFSRIETVGPKAGGELVHTSILAVGISIIAMLIYIWARFELPFALGSVVALFHDVLITLGIFAFFGLEFNLSIIAALLTIVGYSMNDTVVIYDRIRENLIKYRRAKLEDIIDLSVNETFARTMVTGGTTLISLVALIVFGGAVIRPFVVAMTIGVVVGTYSSVFVAGPILLWIGVKNNFQALIKKPKKKQQVIL